jgi:6-phosphogluconolactonase
LDGSLGAEVTPAGTLDVPVWPHQVRIDPSSSTVLLPGRGNYAEDGDSEAPGALKVFSYKNGVLSNRQSIASSGVAGFHARHLEFHPTRPWVFLNMERTPRLLVYRRLGDGSLSNDPVFSVDPLEKGNDPKIDQGLGSIHLHPNGRFLYVANRASGTVEFDGKKDVFAGGENTVVAYSINQETGEPKFLQRIDTRGYSPHTFSVDAGGQLLAVGNMNPRHVREEGTLRFVPSNVALFKIREDGKLDYTGKHEIKTVPGGGLMRWMGLVRVPAA